jgi:hypothetical protein
LLTDIDLVDFEELFVQNLATSRARSWLHQAMGTTLAFVTNDSGGSQEALVLSTLASVLHGPGQLTSSSETDKKNTTGRDVSVTTSTVESVTITTDNLTYSRKDVEDIEITHYAACELGSLLSQTDGKPALQPKTFAHIVLYYRSEMEHDEDIVKTTVKCGYYQIPTHKASKNKDFSNVPVNDSGVQHQRSVVQ